MTAFTPRVIAVLLVLALPGCAVKMAVPGFVYPTSETGESAEWPKLANTASLAEDISVSEKPAVAATTTLESRANGMRQRAAALKRPILSAEDRRKLKEIQNKKTTKPSDS